MPKVHAALPTGPHRDLLMARLKVLVPRSSVSVSCLVGIGQSSLLTGRRVTQRYIAGRVPRAAFSDFKHLAPRATVKVSYTDRMVRGPSAWIHWAFADCNAIAIFAWCMVHGRYEPRLTSLGPSLYSLVSWAKVRDTSLTRQGPAKKFKGGGGVVGSDARIFQGPRKNRRHSLSNDA